MRISPSHSRRSNPSLPGFAAALVALTVTFACAAGAQVKPEKIRIGYAAVGTSLDKAHATLQKPYSAQELVATMQQVMLASTLGKKSTMR